MKSPRRSSTTTMRGPRFTDLAVLLLTGSACGQQFTLSQFQKLTSLTLPLGCVSAYNTPIRGCESSDFGNGNTCSRSCRKGVRRVQKNIQASCPNVDPMSNTLLLDAQSGELVDTLCGERQRTTTSPASPPAPTTSRSPPPPPPPPPTSRKPPGTTISVSIRPTPPPGTIATTEQNTPSPTNGQGSNPTSQLTSPSSSPPQTDSGDATPTSRADPPKRPTPPGSGGGSPFDVETSGSPTNRPRSTAIVGFAVALVSLSLALWS